MTLRSGPTHVHHVRLVEGEKRGRRPVLERTPRPTHAVSYREADAIPAVAPKVHVVATAAPRQPRWRADDRWRIDVAPGRTQVRVGGMEEGIAFKALEVPASRRVRTERLAVASSEATFGVRGRAAARGLVSLVSSRRAVVLLSACVR